MILWEGDSWVHGGGSTWITGSFDPELHTVYWGIGNPGPFNASVRKGDNLYTNSVLALDPKTGKIKWHFQFTPNDPYDYDSVAEMILADMTVEGRPTKVVMDANRNCFVYVLDRTDGKLLAANQYGHQNWASKIDLEYRQTGRDRSFQEGARRREGDDLSRVPRLQELDAEFVQSADRDRLCQHARHRHALQGNPADVQGRRTISRRRLPSGYVGLAGRGRGPRGYLKASIR